MNRETIVLRLPDELLRKLERWTKHSQKRMGTSWSRNDQIVWILRNYEPPED